MISMKTLPIKRILRAQKMPDRHNPPYYAWVVKFETRAGLILEKHSVMLKSATLRELNDLAQVAPQLLEP